MTTEAWLAIVDVISKVILGVAGLLVSWALYLQNKQRGRETWIRTYAEFHREFWNDLHFQEVRCWLAYPAAYRRLRTVLIKRQKLANEARDAKELNKEEYVMLEKLDKYLNMIMRAVTINPEVSTQRDFWDSLHFKYWLNACLDTRRPELAWYIEKFYKPLFIFGQSPEVRRAGEEMGFQR
jgi:hypothetical protein